MSLREIVLAFVAGREAKFRLHKQFRYVSSGAGVLEPALADCVAARGDGDAMRAALLVSAAMTVLRTAFATWRPEQDYTELVRLVRHGFDLIGAGFLEGPSS